MKNSVEITKDLIRFKTVKGEEEEFEEAFNYVEDYFQETDLEVKKYVNNGYTSIVITSEENPEILLHGHIDVVNAEEEMFEPEETREKINGRGSADMKAGLACLMKSLKELDQADELGSTGLMIVSDEEIGGFNGAKILAEEHYSPSFALSAEPNSTDSEMQIVTHQKGVMRVTLTAEGVNAHGSKPWMGENAAERLWEAFHKFKQNFNIDKDSWTTTVNMGYFKSGEVMNVVPDTAEAGLDIRYTEEYPPEEIIEDLKELEGADYEVGAEDPQLKTDRSDGYVKSLQSVAENTVNVDMMKKTAASDMRHFSEQGVPSVVMGPKGGSIHGDDEYVLKESMNQFENIIKEFIRKES